MNLTKYEESAKATPADAVFREISMDTTYRLRFLIYLAAFMLLMSVCFVYAEPLPSPNPLLFQLTPQHAGFLAASSEAPTFDHDALRATVPEISPQVLERVETASHPRHGLFHRARHTVIRPLLPNAPIQFFVLDGGPDSPVYPLRTR
jgi:hypothetical protein